MHSDTEPSHPASEGPKREQSRHIPVIGSADTVTADERFILTVAVFAGGLVGVLLLLGRWHAGRVLGASLMALSTVVYFSAFALARRRDRRIARESNREPPRVSTDEKIIGAVFILYGVIVCWGALISERLDTRLLGITWLALMGISVMVSAVKSIRRRMRNRRHESVSS